MNYRQCKLERVSGCITESTTTWLPDKVAKIGKTLSLRGDGDGWRVVWVGADAVPEERLPDCPRLGVVR